MSFRLCLSGGGIPQTTTGTCNQQMDCVCQNGKSRSVTCLVHQPEGFLYFDVYAEFLKNTSSILNIVFGYMNVLYGCIGVSFF